ncbi:hypothetical protein bcgnr5372_37280 [Bacillus luti]|nr:hypothetical protein [Bacillus cereus]HDR8330046.1 hypothetical protein [Bacillus cereus]HDR8337268.1 hypothetical protein [Bacillus cereus]
MGEILEGVREASAQLFREVELRNWAMEVLDEYDPEFKFNEVRQNSPTSSSQR